MGKSDQQSVLATLAGEKEAYGALVARHSQRVFRVAFRITGDEAEADEVVQETFLRGYQKLESFKSNADFGTWIYRIAVNCALDQADKRKRDRAHRIAEESDPDEGSVQVADGAAGPERLLLSREIHARHVVAMQSLSAVERTAFVLRHLEDRSTEEIAAILAIAPNAAKQSVFRAVQKLRQRLSPLWVNR
jgi:RNA polymerase sigma-70 factor, ECF subfamily